MKVLISIVILLFTTANLKAQPTIQKMKYFAVGDTFRYAVCDTTNITCGDPGTNKTWDFTFLNKIDSELNYITDTIGQPYVQYYPGTNIVWAQVIKGNIYNNYLAQSSDTTYNLGYSVSNTKYHHYDTKLDAIRPFNELTAAVDSYSTGSTFGSVTFSSDGYGTLQLPNKTFTDVLRIKMVRVSKDTLVIPSNPIYVTEVEYQWFSNDFPWPLMRWDSAHVTGGMNYNNKRITILPYNPVSIESIVNKAKGYSSYFQDNKLIVNGNFSNNKKYVLTIHNLSGIEIFTQPFTNNTSQAIFDIDKPIPSGLYIISVFNTNNKTPIILRSVKY